MANLYLLIEDDELPSSTHVKLHHVVFPVAASSCLNAMWFFRPEELEPYQYCPIVGPQTVGVS